MSTHPTPSRLAPVITLALSLSPLLSGSALAQEQTQEQTQERAPRLAPTPSSLSLGSRPESWGEPAPRQELKFLGVFSSKATLSNVSATGLLADQLVGRLYGSNGSTTLSEGRGIMESRALGFFDYQPQSVNGRARLKAGFEVDFTFGDSANAAGSNSGGAINGDQVNLQTKRLMMELDLAPGLTLAVGLQPLADSAFNPTSSDPFDLLLGGGRLMFWGTDAAGVSLFGRYGEHVGRLSVFQLNLNEAARDDDVMLWMADTQLQLPALTTVGLHAWLLSDRSGERAGGVDSALPAYTGASGLNLSPDYAHATLMWFGADLSFNRARRGGPASADLAVFANTGRFDLQPGACRALDRCPTLNGAEVAPFDPTEGDLLAFFLDAQFGYRYGRGDGDAITLGLTYSTGDNQPDDRVLSSVVTGNAFGTPGALYAHHRALLLFPDPRSVNRHVGVVYDPGNLGYGLQALTLALSRDLWPEVVNAKLGFAYASSAAQPIDSEERFIGAELNAEVLYRPAPFLWLGAHVGAARLGRFLESASRVPTSPIPASNRPWSAALSVTWVQL